MHCSAAVSQKNKTKATFFAKILGDAMCPIKASVSGHWNRSEFVRCGTHGADIIVVGKPEYADRFEDWAYEEEGLKFYRRNFQPDELRMFGKRPRPINSNSNNSTSNKA